MCAAFKMQIDRYENKRNRLAAVTRNTLAYAAYTYNALEQLTSRNTAAVGAPAGTVHYLYDQDGHLIAEANAATGATTRDYIWLASNDNDPVDLPLAIAEAATLTMVHADHLGRPTRMTDAARATVWQAIWKPWGEIHSLSGTLPQNLRYPGQYYQIETGLHYNHHRNYDPITGRYTQADPLRFVDGPSMYAYAGNSPYMNTDREGRFWWMVGGAAFGGGLDLGLQLYNNGGRFECVEWGSVAQSAVLGAFGGIGSGALRVGGRAGFRKFLANEVGGKKFRINKNKLKEAKERQKELEVRYHKNNQRPSTEQKHTDLRSGRQTTKNRLKDGWSSNK
jgi:RHS repeat-associated protein